MAEPSAENPKDCEPSKSGIEGPGGYNGKRPASIAAPVKSYPGSGKLGAGDKSGKGGGLIEGPASKK